MSHLPRSLLIGAACLLSTGVSRTAFAWVESSITSDTVSLQIDKSGQAVVSHELWMKIRGGPFKGTSLEGVDGDAEPLAEAQVEKFGSNGRSEFTKPLLLSRGDDDSLYIEIDDRAGLRAGTYAFRFKYRTDLRQRGRIVPRGSWAQLSWIGPRYPAGLDVAKVTFQLPYAPIAPRLPESDPDLGEIGHGSLPSEAMLSTLRRSSESDLLELVRPHVAKGEPVLWRLWAAQSTFPWMTGPRARDTVSAPNSLPTPRAPLGKGIPLAFSAVGAMSFAIAALLKDAAVRKLALAEGTQARPWLPIERHWRATCAGILLGTAILLAVRFDAPSVAVMLALLAQACVAYRAFAPTRKLRGPGRWLLLRPDEALANTTTKYAGAWLDASTWQGKSVLGLWSLAWLGICAKMAAAQPYLSVLALIAVPIPWSLLLTATRAELPSGRRARAHAELRRIHRRFSREALVRVHPMARFGEGDACPDEIRLKLAPKVAPSGLIGLEIATHPHASHPASCLLVRVKEESEAHRRLATRFAFSRGRAADERVAIYAPAISAQSRIVRQVQQILFESTSRISPIRRYLDSIWGASRHDARSSGKGSNTSKPAKPQVPAQATRAA